MIAVEEGAAPVDGPGHEGGGAALLREQVIQELLAQVQESQRRELLSRIADVQARGGTAALLAAELRVTGKTLTRRCERLGIPPVREAFVWLRILWAAKLLEEPGATVDAVAAALGYAAVAVLRRAFKTYLGLTPTQLLGETGGPTQVVLDRFVRELDQLDKLRPRDRRRRGAA